jgi:hypothetical protein
MTYEKCKSVRKCQRKFRRKFSNIRAPHRNTIHNLVKKLRTNGILIDKRTSLRRTLLSEELFKILELGWNTFLVNRLGGLSTKQRYEESQQEEQQKY